MDDALVKERYNTTEDIFEMNNGCICCTVRLSVTRLIVCAAVIYDQCSLVDADAVSCLRSAAT